MKTEQRKFKMQLGKFNTLKIIREQPQGVYLADEEGNEVLLPNKYVPEEYKIYDEVKVFVYTDSEDRDVATTQVPLLTRGSFGYLEVVAVSEYGAFLDWGLEKHLFVPFKEQKEKMRVGEWHVVFLYADWSTNRLCASSKLNQFLDIEDLEDDDLPSFEDEVDLLVYAKTDLGYKAIINEQFTGVLYHNELFKQISVGDRLKGYMAKIREDERIDLRLSKDGVEAIEPNAGIILEYLSSHGGETAVTDKSSPEEISQQFCMSKKAFKKAIGSLYKAKKITLEPGKITLVK